ncbi:hypothetical protein BU14_0469s0012 [Porphyra umbilicalis]|uniref:Uncharacterized protein n=1 Tax=Porphyra umbilicalis TaxID=2786 RepID=A0A1X6NU04_PORUM|nr:hypothetical protein BU14_0469s0012 [Porphyra umbilicalis]|eukprot:OSX72099.1 hypothetical protein BU14_0469s0012 [Porphyra umbilicalis]
MDTGQPLGAAAPPPAGVKAEAPVGAGVTPAVGGRGACRPPRRRAVGRMAGATAGTTVAAAAAAGGGRGGGPPRRAAPELTPLQPLGDFDVVSPSTPAARHAPLVDGSPSPLIIVGASPVDPPALVPLPPPLCRLRRHRRRRRRHGRVGALRPLWVAQARDRGAPRRLRVTLYHALPDAGGTDIWAPDRSAWRAFIRERDGDPPPGSPPTWTPAERGRLDAATRRFRWDAPVGAFFYCGAASGCGSSCRRPMSGRPPRRRARHLPRGPRGDAHRPRGAPRWFSMYSDVAATALACVACHADDAWEPTGAEWSAAADAAGAVVDLLSARWSC